ncbi:TadE/TadG family type IV pilus assembly protein [Paenibacillus caseinilyticus]|uniref:Pilus assembly protein TadE n=1 Tax=Paenibacillus mucilaginosus K02 TaxID=997761 RepID=I0BJ42_9BACL|nr:TadE/TadG family type IV pilus assembly protein [Paenibacillus mucilaginosus]AFH62389.1 pilus assembly protein TadE [Paenibacillus mucilaginosus K02]
MKRMKEDGKRSGTGGRQRGRTALRRHRWLREEHGQSLTELALMLPLLLLLVCGVVDFGRVLYAYLHLNLAAQETVRLGGLGRSDAEITAFARSYVHLGGAESLVVTIAPLQAQRRSGEYIKVTLSYPVGYITPLVGGLLPAPVVAADSTIRVE